MVFIPRHPDTQNVLCRHDEASGTAEAGAVVYLSGDSKIAKCAVSGNVPYGFLGQRVKASAAGLPEGFKFPGEIGSSDALLGDPVCVYHSGLFETTHYYLPAGCTAGDRLYAMIGNSTHNGKLIAVAASGAFDHDSTRKVVAIAQETLTSTQASAGERLTVKVLI